MPAKEPMWKQRGEARFSDGVPGIGREDEATEVKRATQHPAAHADDPVQDIEIGIRPAGPDDVNYVKHTWLDAFRRGGFFPSLIDLELYRRSHRTIIATIMDNHSVLVAYDPQDPRILMGFICGDDYPQAPVVHFLYVPSKLRGWGIARALLGRLGWTEGKPIVSSHYTKDARAISDKGKVLVIHNPYFMFDNHRSLLDGKTTPRQHDARIRYQHDSKLYREKVRASEHSPHHVRREGEAAAPRPSVTYRKYYPSRGPKAQREET